MHGLPLAQLHSSWDTQKAVWIYGYSSVIHVACCEIPVHLTLLLLENPCWSIADVAWLCLFAAQLSVFRFCLTISALHMDTSKMQPLPQHPVLTEAKPCDPVTLSIDMDNGRGDQRLC